MEYFDIFNVVSDMVIEVDTAGEVLYFHRSFKYMEIFRLSVYDWIKYEYALSI